MAKTESIDELARRVLEATGISPEPPIALDQLARSLGVDGIVQRRMIEDGRLERGGGRTVVYLRQAARPTRQRFTLGHELGHLLLAGPEKEFVAQRSWTGLDAEERFCDEFAAALLLPSHWVRQRFGRCPERLAVVRELSDLAEASLSASLVRLRELVGWRRSLLHWRRYDGDWRLVMTAGVPSRFHSRVTSMATTRTVLDKLVGSSGDLTGKLPLAVDRMPREVPVEIAVTASSAVALASLH
jgi:hypothetical protein